MSKHYERNNVRSSWRRWYAGLIACALAMPTLAHHSGAMFDDKLSVTLAGTVRQFQWTNPHCWIQVLVDEKSGPAEWSVEMGSPSQLFRGGVAPAPAPVVRKTALVLPPLADRTHG